MDQSVCRIDTKVSVLQHFVLLIDMSTCYYCRIIMYVQLLQAAQMILTPVMV